MTEYLAWYRRMTRLIITPPSQSRPPNHYQPSTSDLLLAHAVAEMHARLCRATETISDLPADKALPFALETIQSLTTFYGQSLSRVGHSRLIEQPQVSYSSVHTQPIRPPPHHGGQTSRAFRAPSPIVRPPLRTPVPTVRPTLRTPSPLMRPPSRTPPPSIHPPSPPPPLITPNQPLHSTPQHTIVTSPPLVQRHYNRVRRRGTTYSRGGVALHDIPEDGSTLPSSSSLLGKKQRTS